MNQLLAHTLVATDDTPSRWLYLLHGIYGSGRNWGSVARRLTQERPEWGAVLVDLRLHGGSTGFAPPHTLARCVEDLVHLEEHLGFAPEAVLGHSFGGKVALLRAADAAAPPAQVWLADSTLRVGAPSGTAWALVEIVRSLPTTFESREQLAEALVPHGYAAPVGHWLAMNLERTDGGLRWRLDWTGVEEMLRDYFRVDAWAALDRLAQDTEIHVIRAADSKALDAATVERLEAAGDHVHLHTIAGGHWINVDNPDGVLDLLTRELP